MQFKNEDGSITLEAALVIPVFMLFIVFMASIIRISVAEIALNKSVTETTQIIATHAYPATILSEELEDVASKKLSGISISEISLSDVENLIGTTLLEALDINVSSSNYLEKLGNGVIKPTIQKKFTENTGSHMDGSNITVDVDLPGSINGSAGSYFGITATYDLDLTVPFVEKTITIKKQAYERLWVGGY